MMGSFRQLSTVAMLLALLGCQKAPRQLRDSEGRTFHATCTPEGNCKLAQQSGPKRPDKPAQTLLRGGRLVGICDVTDGEAPAGPHDCRPLGCESDQDCPPAHGMKD